MDLFQAGVLGFIQGVTEFLPVSSSGHLIFIPKIFGWTDQGLAFDVVVHLGTLLAVLVYFRKKILGLAKNFKLRTKGGVKLMTAENKLAWFVLLSIVPAGLTGVVLGDWLESFSRNTTVVGISLIFWAFVLAAADGVAKGFKDAKVELSLDKMNWKKWLFISCAQVFALVPGTSRSGVTMSAGLFSRFDKKSAAEFSFLMSIPVISAAGVFKVLNLVQSDVNIAYGVFAFGFICSAVSGFLAIWVFMKIIERWSFMPFVVYRVLVGIIILNYL